MQETEPIIVDRLQNTTCSQAQSTMKQGYTQCLHNSEHHSPKFFFFKLGNYCQRVTVSPSVAQQLYV